jgi:hypothetical protein
MLERSEVNLRRSRRSKLDAVFRKSCVRTSLGRGDWSRLFKTHAPQSRS